MASQQQLDLEHKFFLAVKGPVLSLQSIWCYKASCTNCRTITQSELTHTHRLFGEDGGCFPPPVASGAMFPEWGQWEGASCSAGWASLPAPDNFTIPALAGGDNHIKLPWKEALNSAPVSLRVWHPAVSPEHAADVTMTRFVFPIFYSMPSLFF